MKTSSMTRAFFGALLATAAVPPAYAAEGDPASEGDADLDTRKLDDRLRLYWGSEIRDVESLEKRLFRKDSRFEFGLYSGVIPNDDFYSYYPIGLRAGYFFTEDIGAELWGSYLISVASDLKSFLEDNFNSSLLVDVPQSLQWLAGANVLWSPIHGKLGIFTEKLAHFDVYLAFGVGAIGSEVRQLNSVKSKVDIGGNVGLGMRFFIDDLIALRFDYRQFFYPAEAGGLTHPAELTLGISLFTSAPE